MAENTSRLPTLRWIWQHRSTVCLTSLFMVKRTNACALKKLMSTYSTLLTHCSVADVSYIEEVRGETSLWGSVLSLSALTHYLRLRVLRQHKRKTSHEMSPHKCNVLRCNGANMCAYWTCRNPRDSVCVNALWLNFAFCIQIYVFSI